MKKTLAKYSISTIGLLLVALGIALSIISNLGTAPLSCPSYILSLKWSPTVGEFTVIVNTVLLLIQILILGKGFKAKYLMQIPASVLFGYMIDLWMIVLGFIHPVTLVSRLSFVGLGCLVTATGVSLEVASQAWMLSAEMTVYALTKVNTKPFGTLKIIMDCLFVILSSGISFLLFKNPFGGFEYNGLSNALLARDPGVLIGMGTLILAFLPGFLMRWTDPPVHRILSRLRSEESDTKWDRRTKTQNSL